MQRTRSSVKALRILDQELSSLLARHPAGRYSSPGPGGTGIGIAIFRGDRSSLLAVFSTIFFAFFLALA